jgi:AI-2 transport protein TqsA
LFVLAAVGVVLAGMRLAAPVLNPILFALVFAALFAPVYSWLRLRLPTALALLSMLVGLTILFGGLLVLLSASITELTSRLGFYAQRLNGQVGDIQGLIDRLGLSDVDLRAMRYPAAPSSGHSARSSPD